MPAHPYPRWPLFNRSVVAAFPCSVTLGLSHQEALRFRRTSSPSGKRDGRPMPLVLRTVVSTAAGCVLPVRRGHLGSLYVPATLHPSGSAVL